MVKYRVNGKKAKHLLNNLYDRTEFFLFFSERRQFERHHTMLSVQQHERYNKMSQLHILS